MVSILYRIIVQPLTDCNEYTVEKERNMKNRKPGAIFTAVLITALSTMAAGTVIAGETAPMTPELATKMEMVRKQQEQKITPEKRKAAAEALKAERIKIHKAKEAAKQAAPATTENK